jgi:peptidyl-prolyl cis-trans isomerase B (cyclophilin B)
MKRLFAILTLFLSLCMTFAAHADESSPRVRMETSMGTIIIELNTKAAPKTVANFLGYVREGFYNNTIFHRVIKSFMIQGGGFTPLMQEKTTRSPVVNEADNGLNNDAGTIAMARTSAPHSATAQFFINVKNNVFLNHTDKTARGWGYCVFGRVVQGMEVVHAIANVKTAPRFGYGDVPVKPVIIKEVTLLKPPTKEKERLFRKPVGWALPTDDSGYGQYLVSTGVGDAHPTTHTA